MPDYKSMYAVLFHAMTKAITIMQEARQQTEEMYISSDDPIIRIMPPNNDGESEDGDYQE